MPAVDPVMMIDAPSGDVRHGHRHGVHDPDQIDVDGIDEVHGIGLAHGHRQDPGVGHHDVEPPDARDPALHGVPQLLRSRTSA